MKYERIPPPHDIPDELMIHCSSFPPHTWELMERCYPNHHIAASRDIASLEAAARLWWLARKTHARHVECDCPTCMPYAKGGG